MTQTSEAAALVAAAERLRDAMVAGVPCDPVRDMPGIAACPEAGHAVQPVDERGALRYRKQISAGPEAGYAVQQINTEHWLRAGRRVSGHKVGLTNPAVQEQLGMDEPIWGVLFADRCRTDGDDLGGAGLIEPRVEVEVAVVLGADLDKGSHTVADVISATAYVLPALEIVDSRIAGWDITNFDMIADNAGAGLYVLGTRPVPLAAVDLRRVEMELKINGKPAATGNGAACLGNPLNSVVWLADALSQHGTPLQAGETIMTGSLCGMLPLTPGDELHAEIEAVGTVSAQLSTG